MKDAVEQANREALESSFSVPPIAELSQQLRGRARSRGDRRRRRLPTLWRASERPAACVVRTLRAFVNEVAARVVKASTLQAREPTTERECLGLSQCHRAISRF